MIPGEGISYADALTAISNGANTAQDIEAVCNRWNVTPEQLYTDLYGNENLQFFKTSNGNTTVIKGVNSTQYGGYYGSAATSGAQSSVDLSHEINSNTRGVTTKTATKVTTPVNTSINAQTGKIQMDSELTHIGGQSITDGTLSLGTVATATIAAGVGIGLGKTVDSLLYQANPNFWDANNMSTLNPATWGSITQGIDESDPWYTRLGATAFNAIFITDENTGTTQMMVPEDIIAYCASYMQEQGAFSAHTVDVAGGTVENYSIQGGVYTYDVTVSNPNTPNLIMFAFGGVNIAPGHFKIGGLVSGATTRVALFPSATIPGNFDLVIASDKQPTNNVFGHQIYGPDESNPNYWGPGGGSNASYYTNTNTVYYCVIENYSYYTERIISYLTPLSERQNFDYKYVAYLMIYGTHQTIDEGDIPGFDNQPNATLPDFSGISDITDISEVLAALKQQYPDIFDDSEGILQESVLEDGTTVQTKYYPIPIPTPNPDNANQPTGGHGTENEPTTQLNHNVDPGNASASLLQQLAQYVLTQPTVPGVDTTNPPDTGEGSTPAVVVPSGSASALFSVYNPTQAQVDSFGAWLWSSAFVDQLLKMFNDPMESIISLHKVFATPSTGRSQNIYVGYLDSGVSSATVTNQYTSVDCGTVTLDEYFGNMLDYTATQIELYLPFVGIVSLNVDDVMRGKIHIVYHVDVLTGACLVDVEVIRDMAGGTLYQYSGDCAVHYPLSSGSYMGIVGGLLSVAAGVGGTIATGGAALPVIMGAGAAAMSSHTDVARSGGFSANSGAMGIKKPYLIINRPQTALAEYYLQLEGIGSNQNVILSECTGYVKIKDVQLENINAYGTELNEIESILRGGVIL